MIGQTISHYKILEKLGEGGMGVVYKAQDLRLGRTVALKFLPEHLWQDSSAKARFIREAKGASAINHQNIATVHDIDEAEGKSFIVMEYVEGKTLKELAQQGLKLPQVLEFAVQAAEGLSAAHKKEILHRDIKSDNIMATKENLVKIMDFGLAKLKGVSKLTESGATVGTIAYMSPEQTKGEEIDQRSDIFSLGVVLYELITGKLPFPGDHNAAISYSICYEEPEPLARYKSDVPEGVQKIVDKTLKKDKNLRYQSAADLLADLRNEKKNLEQGKPLPQKPRKKWLPFLVPAGIGLLVLLFLIFKPFNIEIGTDKETAAAENSLAVMYFENVADPEDKDKTAQMITSLLITGLSESENLRVISRQRLYDILNLMCKGDVKVIDRKLASEVAKKAGVKWILTGEVLQTKPNLVVTGEISEVRGGRVLASQRVNGASNEDIFAVVDKLGWDLKNNLSLPLKADTENNKPVAAVTTHSPEAYRYYLEGLDYDNKLYTSEAKRSYGMALALDSTFAMAYYRLAGLVGGAEGKNLIAQAVKYSGKVSQKDKYYIKALELGKAGDTLKRIEQLKKITKRYPDEKEAFYMLGNIFYSSLKKPKEAIPYLIAAIEIDPLYKLAYNQLAYAYNDAGDFEKAIQAINKYISIAPNEANPYDSRGEIYANNGKIELAIESYKKAVEIKPDFHESWNKLAELYANNGQIDPAIESHRKVLEIRPDRFESLEQMGHLYLFKRDYIRAESCYQQIFASGSKGWRSWARYHLALIPLNQGKFAEALAVLDQGIVADRLEREERGWLAAKHVGKAIIYVEQKNWQMALQEAKKTMEIQHKANPNDPAYMRDFFVWCLTLAGETGQAEEVARALKSGIAKKDTSQMYRWWVADGLVKLAQGKLPEALNSFEKMAKGTPEFQYHFVLVETYIKLGRLAEAVSELEKMLSQYDQTRATAMPIWAVKAYYLLGLAYEKSGWNQKAIKNYEEFLDIWKNADPGIAEVEDAKQRLARLKKKV